MKTTALIEAPAQILPDSSPVDRLILESAPAETRYTQAKEKARYGISAVADELTRRIGAEMTEQAVEGILGKLNARALLEKLHVLDPKGEKAVQTDYRPAVEATAHYVVIALNARIELEDDPNLKLKLQRLSIAANAIHQNTGVKEAVTDLSTQTGNGFTDATIKYTNNLLSWAEKKAADIVFKIEDGIDSKLVGYALTPDLNGLARIIALCRIYNEGIASSEREQLDLEATRLPARVASMIQKVVSFAVENKKLLKSPQRAHDSVKLLES